MWSFNSVLFKIKFDCRFYGKDQIVISFNTKPCHIQESDISNRVASKRAPNKLRRRYRSWTKEKIGRKEMKKEDVSHTMGAHFDLLWRTYLQTLQTHQLPATRIPRHYSPSSYCTNTTPPVSIRYRCAWYAPINTLPHHHSAALCFCPKDTAPPSPAFRIPPGNKKRGF